MKLPCWIKHDWDKYGQPKVLIQDSYTYYSLYKHTTKWKRQERVCKKCGIISYRDFDYEQFKKILGN